MTSLPDAANLVQLDRVSKAYGSRKALDGVSFTVPEGSVCGLLGPNGSGKTTALRILLGLSRADDGSALLMGEPAKGRARREVARTTGALIETPALYGRASATTNMRIEAATRGLRDHESEIQELLDLVGLGSRADGRVKSFSLGMKQRLALAQSLLGRPRLVILDEPTNGLDPKGIVEIRNLIASLPGRGTTVLVSSHLLAEVQAMCDRVTIIDQGRLVADGPLEELLGGAAGTAWRVRVPASDQAIATTALRDVGLTVEAGEGGLLSVGGPVTDGSQLTVLLAGAGVYLSELVPVRPDLESTFLSLTGSGEDSDQG